MNNSIRYIISINYVLIYNGENSVQYLLSSLRALTILLISESKRKPCLYLFYSTEFTAGYLM
jgi:hypothetical protein